MSRCFRRSIYIHEDYTKMPIKKPSQGHLSVVRKQKIKNGKNKRKAKHRSPEWDELLKRAGVARLPEPDLFQDGMNHELVHDDNTQFIKQSLKQSLIQSTRMTVLGQGPPEETWLDPPNGGIYVEEDSANVYLHVADLGWVQLNGWCPDVGEEDPCQENPEDPMSGDMYLNILTSDLFYFVEGFGWVLLNGIEGPPGPNGPPGPPGFSDIFYAVTPRTEQVLKIQPQAVKWEIPEFQDTDYSLQDDQTSLRIQNCGVDPARYQVQIKLSIHRKDELIKLTKSGVEFYLNQDDELVPGSLTYAMMPFAGQHSLFINVIVEVLGGSEIDLVLEGRATGQGDLVILQDQSNCWQVVKLG